MEYPTRNGVAICPLDIWLPESNLNPNKDKSYNNHHSEWTARRFGRSILFQVFRDLEQNQMYLPLDVHAWLHETYDPPRMPTEYEAMDRIELAYYENENLHVKGNKGYVLRPVTKDIFQLCDKDYNRLMRGL